MQGTPENGEPLGYRRYADRVVVYSRMEKAGRSGEVPTAFNPDEPSPAGVGVAVHVYDVQHRRQPAQSRPPAMNPPLRIGIQ